MVTITDNYNGFERLENITLRISRHELIDLIAEITYNNKNFNPRLWSKFDADRLRKAAQTIEMNLINIKNQ